jgi:hypothetical protein
MYPIKGSDVKGSVPSNPTTTVTWIVTVSFTTLLSNVHFYPVGNTACIKSFALCEPLSDHNQSTVIAPK